MVASATQAKVLRYIEPGRRYYLSSHEFLCNHVRVLSVLVAMGKVAKGVDQEQGGRVYYERRKFAPPAFTTADIEAAVETLREHNAPPVECPDCGTGYYIVNWDRRNEVLCDCGGVLLEAVR